jgi:hypothetical protein
VERLEGLDDWNLTADEGDIAHFVNADPALRSHNADRTFEKPARGHTPAQLNLDSRRQLRTRKKSPLRYSPVLMSRSRVGTPWGPGLVQVPLPSVRVFHSASIQFILLVLELSAQSCIDLFVIPLPLVFSALKYPPNANMRLES